MAGNDYASLTSVEVCAGAGGQALGLEQAGFDHLACVEIDPAAVATLRANRPGWNVIQGDLREWQPDNDWYGVDLLAGGVPCPPFSLAGRQLGRDDERDLFPEMVRLAEQLAPRAVLIENVRGLLSSKFEGYRQEIQEKFEGLGYVCCGWHLINAADFGVPQARQRTLFVAMTPNAAEHFTWETKQVKRKTVAQALRKHLSHWEGYSEWAESASEVAPALVGGSKKHGGADLGPTRARAAWKAMGVNGISLADEPPESGWQGEVRLTVEMAATIQGFPRSWRFQGRKTAAYRQVGNAFPPPVARAIGINIAQALRQSDTLEG